MEKHSLLCFSHLRWNFVFQRPNHLMMRAAQERRVLFVEEPLFDAATSVPELTQVAENLYRLVPHLVPDRPDAEDRRSLRNMLSSCCKELAISRPIHWFYTPMMLPLVDGMADSLTVYDCMDELSNFAFAPPELRHLEEALMAKAELMFTGGMALYEKKRACHHNVHGVPSSVDTAFFAQARTPRPIPIDQGAVARPRIGYCGVLDERLDLGLIERIARERPDFQLVLIGPVVKIEEGDLPRRSNIHYLGAKSYAELPSYLSGWDAAIMPFALNDATRFISPTKTPEYLAAGLPVVSTAIRDVVEPYERLGLVRVGGDPEAFIAHLDALLSGSQPVDTAARDAFLSTISWDRTWQRMSNLLEDALSARGTAQPPQTSQPGKERQQHV